MHATPTHSGWVEPLPILAGQSPLAAFPPAPGSRSRCPSGADIRLSSPKRFLSERLYPHGSQSALRASLQTFVVAAPRHAQVCMQPLLVGLEQNLLAAILASTRLPPPLCLGGHSFRRVLPRFPAYLFHPHGYPSWLGPLDSFTVVALHVLGLHATPVLYGRTEPPGRLPSCARLPLEVVGLPRLSPRLSGFRRGFFSPHGSRPPVGLSTAFRYRSSRRAQVCTLPLSVWSRTAPPGRLHPSTRTLTASSRIPRRLEPFPAIAVPDSRPFPSRFLDSR